MKLSFLSQVSFTVSGDMVIKIQHVIHQIKCWGLILDRINDPHVYESSCGSNDPNALCTLLPPPECSWVRHWEHRGSVPQVLGKKDAPARPHSKGVIERTGLVSHIPLVFCCSVHQEQCRSWAAQSQASAAVKPVLVPPLWLRIPCFVKKHLHTWKTR